MATRTAPSASSTRRRRLLLGLSAAAITPAAALLPAGAGAQAGSYPTRPIQIVVPFPPGGGVDLYARTVQAELQKLLGQPVVIDNRPGASGMIGAEIVAKAAPDGYTLMLGNIAVLAMNSATFAKVPYDPQKDFTPIMQTVMVPYVLVVNPKLEVESVEDLIALTQSKPGTITYGSSGAGSAQHMAAELFKSRTGAEMTHVPYKGVGALVTDLIAGHVDIAFADQASMMPHVNGGKLRLVAVAGLERVPELPDVPTIAEAAKLEGFQITGWQGVVGPANLPPAIVERLNRAFNEVQPMPMVAAAFRKAGLTAVGGTPEDLTRHMRKERDMWTQVAQDVGAVVQN